MVSTILVIDDSPPDRSLVLDTLRQAGIFDRILEAKDGLEGLEQLLNESVDVVLCDLEMPGLDGEKLLQMKQSRSGVCDIPILFITASENLGRRARLLEEGACDAITKPFHPADLVARLRLHLRINHLQDELRAKHETLAELSTTDLVTGLRTRRHVSEALAVEFLRARRYRLQLSVLMADLDDFKQTNDQFGHPSGDSVLREVSARLLDLVRATDVAGRYGGDEIVVVLAQSPLEGARTLAERWRQAVEKMSLLSADGREMATTISIGIAEYEWSTESPDDLIAVADSALYRAKKAGGNRSEAG